MSTAQPPIVATSLLSGSVQVRITMHSSAICRDGRCVLVSSVGVNLVAIESPLKSPQGIALLIAA